MLNDDGQRTGMGLAALAVGTLISTAILFHWLFGEVVLGVHDTILGLAFFGGLGVAFPQQTARYSQNVRGVLGAWRKP